MNGQALAFAAPWAEHIALRKAPRCVHCGGRTQKEPCQSSNKNGNAYRPYYSCSSCERFVCFGDMRGVLAENPTCYCDHGMQFSRRGIAGGRARFPRSIFYQCATGGCLFFEYMTDNHDRIMIYSGPVTPRHLTFIGF
ncbi:hypothetical protein BDV37DRAFT_39489 [Aspergillus pseudonomiae]|uniref:GRF-like zinc ribbon domain-containing protein n=1 Tax=Aspergillus pseudonomiae TaxID=1506151 RepID=A0A5N7DKP2_9EURO|nr:uncharacterized protein BDV37DRAFT_39489 [Aspergillus pseudonomiae]KAE8407010.1 hypothetical protein BDV37DRAFT_39489 [Aspergillus pseudonomiae]